MDESTRFLILSLNGGTFAIPISRLLEITIARGIQKDDKLTAVFEGKYEFRGKWIPVINIKKILKLPGNSGSSLLVVRSAKGILGLLVDAVMEIIDAGQKPAPVPRGVVNPSLRTYSGILRHKGELILLINEEGLLQ